MWPKACVALLYELDVVAGAQRRRREEIYFNALPEHAEGYNLQRPRIHHPRAKRAITRCSGARVRHGAPAPPRYREAGWCAQRAGGMGDMPAHPVSRMGERARLAWQRAFNGAGPSLHRAVASTRRASKVLLRPFDPRRVFAAENGFRDLSVI